MSENLMHKRDFMDDLSTKWRHGSKSDYSVVNAKYMKERTNNHAADSMEKFVENLVKTWEVENAYKIRPEDWKTVDQEKFTISTNGGRRYTLKENIELGSYNMLLDKCVLWKQVTNQESQDMFRGAIPGGFAWELTELISGPPVVSFTWRHWGKWEGKYQYLEPTGEEFEFFGTCVAKVDDKLKITSVDIYYDPTPMLAILTGFNKRGVCPFIPDQQ